MRRSGKLAMVVACTALWSVGSTTGASARVCGDADGNFMVTITDGVQVLRSAAGLSSICTENPPICDVDGSGTTTVTDGVNVLRKAAGLAMTEACPSGATADVQTVTDTVVPFLTLALPELQNVRISSASLRVAGTQDCADGGTRTTTKRGDARTVTFDAWQVTQPGLGCFQFDGSIQAQLGLFGTVSFELKLTDLGSSKVVDFDGTIQGASQFDGGFVFDGGPLIVRGPSEGPETFRLTFNQMSVDGNGRTVSGSLEAEDTGSSFDLRTTALTIQGRTAARVHVVRDDDSTRDYELNLQTGDLFPAP